MSGQGTPCRREYSGNTVSSGGPPISNTSMDVEECRGRSVSEIALQSNPGTKVPALTCKVKYGARSQGRRIEHAGDHLAGDGVIFL